MLRRVAIVVLIATTIPAEASAQEIDPAGLASGCAVAAPKYWYLPARFEWAFWNSLELRGAPATPSIGIGVEVTTGLARYTGAPAPGPSVREGKWGASELRIGPWLAGSIGRPGALAEGGVTLHVGAVYDDPAIAIWLPSFDVRVGLGYADRDGRRGAHGTVALAFAIRTVFSRRTGAIDECERIAAPAATVADATFARWVLSARPAFDGGATEFGIALEFTPTLALYGTRFASRRRSWR
jgi:hypothetical protein